MRLTPAGTVFFATMIVGGLAVIPLGFLLHPINRSTVLALVYLGLYTQAAALLPIRWSRGLQHIFTPPLLAAGLMAPGAGVALVTWLALYDGRRPSQDRPIWLLAALRGAIAITHGTASIAVALIPMPAPWDLPLKTVVYSILIVLINYPLTAAGFALMHRTSVVAELRQNVGLSTLRSMLVLGFAGGLLYQILQVPVGYVMALGLIALLLAVRANIADSQKQARLRVQTLELAAAALDARDSYTESHSARVAELAERIAVVLGLPYRDIETIRTAAMLHDVGKIGVPDGILNKPGPLTAAERVLMNRHPIIGADLIQRHDALVDVSPHVRSHHERWDGTGYPDELRGAEIPIGARIIAVADAYDTLTGVRIYKPTKATPDEAIEDIVKRTGSWYDPVVVEAATTVLRPPRSTNPPPLRAGKTQSRLGGAQLALVLSNTVSAFGDPMTTVAVVVTTVQWTHSAAAVAGIYVLRAAATLGITLLLGDLGDKLPRKVVVVSADAVRAVTLVVLAIAFSAGGLALVLIVVLAHAAATALGTPTRQAAASDLWEPKRLAGAMGLLGTAASLSNLIGFGIAGSLVLWGLQMPGLLVIDALTFAIAGILVARLPGLSRGVTSPRWRPSVMRVFEITGIRAYLALTVMAGIAAGMSFPSLIFVATELVGFRYSAAAYSWLEVALAAGVALGSLAAARIALDAWRTARYGLAVMGLGSLVVAVSNHLWLALCAIFIASVGSALYVVSNQTGVLAITSETERASAMTVRFTAGYIASLLGAFIGASTTAWLSGRATYGIIGGFLFLGVIVFGASLRNPSPSAGLATVEAIASVRGRPTDG